MHFEDTVSAAQAAAESAKQAIAAAQAAAYLANNGLNQASLVPGLDHKLNTSNINHGLGILSGNSTAPSMPLYSQINSQRMDHYSDGPGGTPYESQNFDRSHYPGNEGTRPIQTDNNHVYRRHSHIETMPKQMDGQIVSRRHSYPCSYATAKTLAHTPETSKTHRERQTGPSKALNLTIEPTNRERRTLNLSL